MGSDAISIDVAFLLAVVIVLRLRRRVQARSRRDEALTVLLVLAFGVLVAPTPFGQAVGDLVRALVGGVNDAGL